MHVVSAKKRLSDETIITALIECGSIKEAAQKLGCAPRTIYNRMKAPAFKDLYSQAKSDMIRSATAKLQGHLTGAIDTLVTIMQDGETAAQTRANCAASILQYAARYTEETEIKEQLEALEETLRVTSEVI